MSDVLSKTSEARVFASKINGIEFDVVDPVTARLLSTNAKSDFVEELDEGGEPRRKSNAGSGATGGELELG